MIYRPKPKNGKNNINNMKIPYKCELQNKHKFSLKKTKIKT